MKKAIVGYFDRYDHAQEAVRALVDNGFSRTDISLVASDPTGAYAKYETSPAPGVDEVSNTAAGAGTGAVVGGISGLLVGLGVLAIPGIGPVLAAGPLATTLLGIGVGAAAGGLIGALIDLGIPEEEAQYYAEGLRRGGAVVTVHTLDESTIGRVSDIFERHNVVNIDRRVEEWRQSGWTAYDPAAGPYTASSSAPRAEVQRGTGLSKFEDYSADFRSNFSDTYGNRGHTYDRYEPAYRYGYTLGSDYRYAGKEWSEVEADARRDWETRNQGAWEDFKDSIRYAWDRVRGYSAAEASARSRSRAA